MPDDLRERILHAAVVCVGRYGLSKTSIEDVAREADVGRATVYRYFEGGREQLIADTIAHEVATFFGDLAREVADAPDFASVLELGLLLAHRAVLQHDVLQKVLDTEPERLLPHLTTSGPLILLALTGYLEPRLEALELRDGMTAAEGADWLARMVLSFILGQGSWDLDDPVAVRRLVRGQLLVGVLAGD